MKPIITLAAIGISAFALPANAVQIDTWSGAGPNACNGRCTFERSAQDLSPEEQAELAAVQAEQPEPTRIYVQDGSMFTLATYYRDGQQMTTRGSTVAVLNQPEPAMGWDMGDWQFVKLDDCTNPTVVTSQRIDTAGIPRVNGGGSGGGSFSSGSSFSSGGGSTSGGGRPILITDLFPDPDPIFDPDDPFEIPNPTPIFDPEDPDVEPHPIDPPVAISAVPLPASGLLLLLGVAAPFALKRRKKS